MKESFLQPEDGDELEVFFLGANSNTPNKDKDEGISSAGVSGCCPIGPEGEKGEQGIPAVVPTAKGLVPCPPSIFNKKYPKESPPLTWIAPMPVQTDATLPPNLLEQDPTLGGVYEWDGVLPQPSVPSADPADGEPLPSPDALGHHPACPSASEADKDKWVKKLFMSPLFQKAKKNYEDKKNKLSVKIDDTIESDIITDPIAGRIYKVAGLNMIVRFVGNFLELWEVDYHGNSYYISVNKNMLLKATEYELELYLENE